MARIRASRFKKLFRALASSIPWVEDVEVVRNRWIADMQQMSVQLQDLQREL